MMDKFWKFEIVMVGTLLILLNIAVGVSYAQTTFGSVAGIVTDPTGAAISTVKLTLKNVNTGEIRTGTSSASGEYVFTLLLPGTYQLTAEHSGFVEITVSGLVVEVDTPLRHDITMQLGAVTQRVTVEANPVTVTTDTAAIGNVIGPATMVELPLNGRDFLQLATLSAGVSPPAAQIFGSTTQANSGGRSGLTVSISGSREMSPDFLFDGIESRQDYLGAVGIEPPVDSIAEFKVERGYFSAQFGQPGVVNTVFKSGTNGFHGAAWEFVRNTDLNARNFFSVGVPPYEQNQFGANAGGRILKDKLFYFGDWEQNRIRQGSTGFAIVPTAAEMSGNFQADATVYNPATYNAATNTRQPFANNMIPGPLDAFAQAYIKAGLMVLPNSAPNPTYGGANYFTTLKNIENDLKYDIKIDIVKSTTDRFFARFSYYNSDITNTSVLPDNYNTSPLHARNAVASWQHVFSPSAINDFKAGLDRVFISSGSPYQPTSHPDWPTTFGLTGLNQIPECNAPPSVGLTNYATFGFSFGNCAITGNTNKVFLDNLSVIRGRHSLTMGGQLIRINKHNISSTFANGSFNYTGQYTTNPATGAPGNAVADFLLGDLASASGTAASMPFYLNAWYPDAYFNDDFRVSPKLSINMGLRWQFTQPFVEKYNHLGQFDFAEPGTVWYAGQAGHGREVLTPHHADFAPRLGFAYSPSANWVIRTSAGVFWDRVPGGEDDFAYSSFPALACSYSVTANLFVPTVSPEGLFPSCTTNSIGLSLIGPLGDRKDPYLQQWTFSIQHTLPSHVLFELAYIGSKGTHLSKRFDENVDPNPPALTDQSSVQSRRRYPQWGFMLADMGAGSSEYEGLQLTIRKEYSHGLTFLAGYTWSQTLDDDSYDAQDVRFYNPHSIEKGRAQFDLRNRFVLSGAYKLPFGNNLTGRAKTALAGWEANTIVTLQSGGPFTPLTAVDWSNTGSFWSPRPNRICDGNLPPGQRTQLNWFNKSCFVNPPLDTYGNGGWGYMDFAGDTNVDFAILKDFVAFKDRARVQFRAESFNLFNNVNWQLNVSNIGSFIQVGNPSEGVQTAALPGRIVQLALKFLW